MKFPQPIKKTKKRPNSSCFASAKQISPSPLPRHNTRS